MDQNNEQEKPSSQDTNDVTNKDIASIWKRTKYLPIVLVIAGQLVLIPSNILESILIALCGMVLSGIGLGLWAKRTGRSVLAWFSLAAFIPLLGSAIGLIVMLIQDQGIVDSQRPVKMYVHMLIAFILFFASAIVFDAASGAIMYSVIAIIWVATRSKGRYPWKVKLTVIGIYALLFVMVLVMKNVNNAVSYKNANVIIAACEQHKNKTGVYPTKLNELVPVYLAEIPKARYTMTTYEFRYYRFPEGNEYSLTFVAEAPFARSAYSSKSKSWRRFD